MYFYKPQVNMNGGSASVDYKSMTAAVLKPHAPMAMPEEEMFTPLDNLDYQTMDDALIPASRPPMMVNASASLSATDEAITAEDMDMAISEPMYG